EMTKKLRQLPIWALLAAAAIAVPLSGNGYYLTVGTTVLIFAVLAVGLNIVLGYAGLLDLGYVAFFAIGSYATAMLLHYTDLPYLLAFIVSGTMAGLFGMIIGIPTLRLRTDYLAIVTLGFGEIIRITVTNLDVTGGPTGLYGLREPVVAGYTLASQTTYYWITLAMLIAGLGFSVYIRRTKLGAAWAYIRYSEEVAQAVGVNPFLVKLAAYGLGAIWGGFAGSVYVVSTGAVSPLSFTFVQSLLIVLCVVLGGQGSVLGVVIGALCVIALPEAFRYVQSWRLFAFGIALIALMVWRPMGLIRDRFKVEAPNHPAGPVKHGPAQIHADAEHAQG
ncbi:MAG: branched-chain amino acid ABC transporter permease, partial [Nitrososphaerales archaeon]